MEFSNFLERSQISEFHETNEFNLGDLSSLNLETIMRYQPYDDFEEEREVYQELSNEFNRQNNNQGTVNNQSFFNYDNNDSFHTRYHNPVSNKSIEKELEVDYSIDLYYREGKMPQIIEQENNKINRIISELKPTMQLSKKQPDEKVKVKDRPNKSKGKFSNNSKNSTKSSSNSNNNFLEQSMFNNKKARFKVLKSLKIPERFNEINLKLDMSCHNIYYEKKKNKIKEKIKKDYNIKNIKMENYEKPIIRQFKKFIKSNMERYKGIVSQDKLFWDLFLGNKKEKYTSDEIMYKSKRFDKYNQKFLHYLFRRNDIKELYNNDFKTYCRDKNIKTTLIIGIILLLFEFPLFIVFW